MDATQELISTLQTRIELETTKTQERVSRLSAIIEQREQEGDEAGAVRYRASLQEALEQHELALRPMRNQLMSIATRIAEIRPASPVIIPTISTPAPFLT